MGECGEYLCSEDADCSLLSEGSCVEGVCHGMAWVETAKSSSTVSDMNRLLVEIDKISCQNGEIERCYSTLDRAA